jgi:hypothetical protein
VPVASLRRLHFLIVDYRNYNLFQGGFKDGEAREIGCECRYPRESQSTFQALRIAWYRGSL